LGTLLRHDTSGSARHRYIDHRLLRGFPAFCDA
jgi:hypothetical protein